MRRHGFLLGSLILGASILVWLTLIGLVITAVAIVRADGDTSTVPSLTTPHKAPTAPLPTNYEDGCEAPC